MSETSKRVLGVPEPLLRYVSTDTVLTLAREVEALEKRVTDLEAALARIRDESEDNRIAAIADDALEPKVLVEGGER